MKRIVLIVALIIGLVVIAKLGIMKIHKNFQHSVDHIAERKYRMIYNAPFQEFYSRNFSAPLSLEEVEDYRSAFLRGNDLLSEFHDPFLKNNEHLNYIPLYDSGHSKPIGFAVISAGIDGKRHYQDTLPITIDEFASLDVFYNELEKKPGVYQGDFRDTLFNLRNFLFGRKDLLIEFIDCKEFFLNGYLYEERIAQLAYSAYVSDFKRQLGHFHLIILDDSIQYNSLDNILIATVTDYNVIFKFHSEQKMSGWNSNYEIVGQLKSVDQQRRRIIFENCMAKIP